MENYKNHCSGFTVVNLGVHPGLIFKFLEMGMLIVLCGQQVCNHREKFVVGVISTRHVVKLCQTTSIIFSERRRTNDKLTTV